MIRILVKYQKNRRETFNYKNTLLLVHDNWNDYGYNTNFFVYYYDNMGRPHDVGTLKIYNSYMDTYLENEIMGFPIDINSFLADDEEITYLGDSFCSLGQDLKYYFYLKEYFPEEYTEILSRLCDIAVNENIRKVFIDYKGVQDSLLRESSAVKALREAYEIIGGEHISHEMSFRYSYKPPYSNISAKIEIDFTKNNNFFPNRINAIVGKNGAGKTSMLSCLANAISGNLDEESDSEINFEERPAFYKVLALSFSSFDIFRRPEKNKARSFVYCGIQIEDHNSQNTNSNYRPMNKKEMAGNFHYYLNNLSIRGRYSEWKEIISELIGVDEFNEVNKSIADGNMEFRLSSGQYMLVLAMTMAVANIEEESLLLIDEPELHLHPNAIASLMRMLHKMLDTYNSYAIISTHSPLVLQELPSNRIMKLERKEDNILLARRPNIECFGASISNIVDDTFEVRSNESSYQSILEQAVLEMSEDEILEYFDNKLSLNARMYLKSLYEDLR